MAFGSLFEETDEQVSDTPPWVEEEKSKKPRVPKARKLKVLKEDARGCESCTLDRVRGIKKIFGSIEGKDIAIIAQSPGPDENEEGRELVGRSGEWLWKELKRVGLSREDFDIQNAVRCFPADWVSGSYSEYLKMRSPSPLEIKCCSLHTENALAKMKAKQILVLGQVAAKALLSTRSLPTQKIFWSDKLNARLYLLDHPAFFIRGGASKERLSAFREMLNVFVKDRGRDSDSMSDQFAYLKKQDYRLIKTVDEAKEAIRLIREFTTRGKRIAIDIENDEIDGEQHITIIGISPKIGLSFVFVIYHQDQPVADGQKIKALLKPLLEDTEVRQAYHYGCTDVSKLVEVEDIHVPYESFDHDTYMSEYLRFTEKRAYGLAAISESRFPEFSGYKQIIVPELVASAENVPAAVLKAPLDTQAKYVEKNKLMRVSKLSLETLRLYNGADCDLTKRIEVSNKKHIPQALLQLYVDLSFVLFRMESNGPLFDYEQHAKLDVLYPYKADVELKAMQAQIGDPEFNPGSHTQVYKAIYEVLKLDCPFDGKPNTRKETLQMLALEHEFPNMITKWRKLDKAKGTYIDGYKKCSDVRGGRLRTKWFLTGTRTGRLSSGGGKKGEHESGLVNLQNVANNEHIQNLLTADSRWKKVYRVAGKILAAYAPSVLAFWKEQDTYFKHVAEAKKSGEQFTEKEPVQSAEVKAEFELAAKKMKIWIKKKMPDFRVFLMLDYGQIEVRVAAQLSGDKNLINDCQESDIHSRVGSAMTGWDPEKIKKDKYTRTRTKNVHFGILFGQSEDNTVKYAISMAPPDERTRLFKMTIEEREEYEDGIRKAYRRYFKRYSGIKDFISSQRAFAKEHGYVETMFGMKQTLNIRGNDEEEEDSKEYIADDEGGRSSYWANQAVNGPVQGTAHQVLECGLVNVYRKPEEYDVLGVPVMDVHDALYFSILVLDLIEAYEKSRYLMEHESLATVKEDFPDIDWKVPIVTEAEAGLSLGCKVDLEEGKFTVGSFLLDWYRKRKKQLTDLDKELQSVVTQ